MNNNITTLPFEKFYTPALTDCHSGESKRDSKSPQDSVVYRL